MPAHSANNPNGFHTRYLPSITELKSYSVLALGFVFFSSLIAPARGNQSPLPLTFFRNDTYFILSTSSNTKAIWNLYVYIVNCLVTGQFGPIIQLVDNEYIPTTQIWSSNHTCNDQQLTLEANSTAEAVQDFLEMLNDTISNSTEYESILKGCASLVKHDLLFSVVFPIGITVLLVTLTVSSWIIRRKETKAEHSTNEMPVENGRTHEAINDGGSFQNEISQDEDNLQELLPLNRTRSPKN